MLNNKIISFLSKSIGFIYHPILHRWRHRAESRLHRQVLRASLAVMKRHKADFSSASSPAGKKVRTAIQVHVFYADLLPEFYGHLKGIAVPYNLFVSTDTEEKKSCIEAFFKEHLMTGCRHVAVKVFENRGRDVCPFLAQLHDIYGNYDYIAHFHTKKSLHIDLGDYWRKSLLETLLAVAVPLMMPLHFWKYIQSADCCSPASLKKCGTAMPWQRRTGGMMRQRGSVSPCSA